jgi:hypothetical protein
MIPENETQYRSCKFAHDGCKAIFCSKLCDENAWNSWHQLMCVGFMKYDNIFTTDCLDELEKKSR